MPRPRFWKLPEQKRSSILAAAAEEIAESGVNASMNQIIRRAGISKGAMYYYFDDRDDIIQAVVNHTVDKFLEDMLAEVQAVSSSAEFWTQVRHSIATGGRWFLQHPVSHRLMIHMMAPGAPISMQQMEQRASGLMRGVIETGQQVGAIRSDLPIEYLLPLLMSVGRITDEWLLRALKTAPESFDTVVEMCLNTYKRLAGEDTT